MPLEYRLGTKTDADSVHDFLLNHFRVTEPITSAINASQEDVFNFFIDLRNGGLDNGEYSTLVFDGPEIVAISLNYTKEIDSSDEEISKFDPHADFAQAIEKGPYSSHNANRLVSFVEAVEAGLPGIIGAPLKIFKIDVMCVNRNYQGKGIAAEMLKRAEAAAIKANCSYMVAVATAVASQRLFNKYGFKTIKELPFSCFRENGVVVYQNLPDQGRSGKLMVKSLSVLVQEKDDEDDLK